jgi:peptidoglycan-associated lipoprotein
MVYLGEFFMNIKYYLVLVLTIFVMAGCATKSKPKSELNPTARTPPPIFSDTTGAGLGNLPPGGVGAAVVDATKLPMSRSNTLNPTADLSGVPSERIIYFDYDMSNIKSNARAILEQHATYLTQNPEIYVRLEGHADERGSREYNLALGERRAETAKNTLIMLGVFETQVTTLSYGEERPQAFGHDEQSWQQNRRVELVYQ